MSDPSKVIQNQTLQYDIDLPGHHRQLHVISDPCSHEYEYNIGSGLWEAALEFLTYLSGFPDNYYAGMKILELGCGLAVVGQALHLYGAEVVLTDRQVQMPLLRRNVEANFGEKDCSAPKVHVLDWTQVPDWALHSPWDFIIASDVVYDEECFAPLIDCLVRLATCSHSTHGHTQILLALPDRPETQHFFGAADVAGLTWRRLSHSCPPDPATPVSIYQFVQRAYRNVSCPVVPQTSPGEASPSKRCKVAAREDAGTSRTLVVFDFDWSLVEENSDTWVLDQLGATHIFKRLKATGMPWTQLMDASLLAAHKELGRQQQDILEACVSAPFAACMRQAVAKLAARGCDLVVVSDANSVYIDAILEHHGLKQHFKEVHTNTASWEGGALRVRPHHQDPKPDGCHNCPPNLCKGKVMELLLMQHNYSRVVYLGDGAGDFCPSLRLGPRDFVLSRESYPTGAPCSLLRLARKASARIADCFTGPGLAAAGAAAFPAALAAAAEADCSAAAHAMSAADADGSTAAHAAHHGNALENASTGEIAPVAECAPGGAQFAGETGVVLAYAQPNTVIEGTACSNVAAVFDHAGGHSGGTKSPLAPHGGLPGQGEGVKAGVVADVEPESRCQLRPTQDWAREGDVQQYVPHGQVAALVCPWQTPRQAADLLLELC
ncbi:probable pyridoxal phosphate phosphatase PHOSPHO2 [Coccomyxa sp. Obi]|nr:probable pyridoxal phosphate phosphatase PHOSPHO2 [Coccomyxa sp. Obi]